jgi:hypothetical protein
MEDMRGETLVGNILMEAKALERKMTSTEAQKTLDTLVNTRWLSFDKRRYGGLCYTMGNERPYSAGW